MGSVGCLTKGNIFFWQKILKNRSKYIGDISEQSVVCTVLISAIIIEIFRRKKNIPISYIIPDKNLASPLIPVCLKKSHMIDKYKFTIKCSFHLSYRRRQIRMRVFFHPSVCKGYSWSFGVLKHKSCLWCRGVVAFGFTATWNQRQNICCFWRSNTHW